MDDQRNCFKSYCRSFTRMAVTILIQSKQGHKFCPPSLPNNISTWYNLNLDPLDDIDKILSASLGNKSLSDLPEINILSSLRTSTGEDLNLEIWKFSVHPPSGSFILPNCENDPSNNLQMYYRLSIMLRSILSSSRATPSYKLYSRRQSDNTFVIGYNIIGSALDPFHYLGDQYRTVDLGSIDVPLGSIRVCLYYRTKMIIADDIQDLTAENWKENYYCNENRSYVKNNDEDTRLRNKTPAADKSCEINKVDDGFATPICDRGKGVTFYLGNLTPEYSLEQLDKKRHAADPIISRIPESPNIDRADRNASHEKAFFFLNTTVTGSSTSSESQITANPIHIKQPQEIDEDSSKRRSLDSFPFSRLLSPSFPSPIARRYSASADPPSTLTAAFPGLTVSHNAMQIRAPAARIMMQKPAVSNRNERKACCIHPHSCSPKETPKELIQRLSVNSLNSRMTSSWKDNVETNKLYEQSGLLIHSSQSSLSPSSDSDYDWCDSESLQSPQFPIKFRACSRNVGYCENDEDDSNSESSKTLLEKCKIAPPRLKSFVPIFNCPGSFPDLRAAFCSNPYGRTKSVANLSSGQQSAKSSMDEHANISVEKLKEELNFFERNAQRFDNFVKSVTGPCIAEEFETMHTMVQMWFLDDTCSDLRLPNKATSEVQVTLDDLTKIGVLYFKINADNCEEELKEIRRERGYNYADEVTINKESMANYDEKIKMFAEEHLHTDDEIRYVADGSGYFDVRNQNDKWIRIVVERGDLLILPAGIYHRFVADKKDYIKAIRLFSGVPVWTPLNRPADNNAIRIQYMQEVQRQGTVEN